MKREQETFPYIAHLLNGAEVEWKPLGEVAKVNKGVQLNKTKLKDEGKYPAYNGGKTYSGWTDDFNVEENTTIISQGGASAGFVNFVTTKFWANAHCYYIIPNLEIVNNRYLYQFLKFQEKFFMNSQHGAGIPALAISKLNKHLIPVPPLSVQQEIVRILDKFTQLEAELEAELDCRKRQYEYYCNKLLTFNEITGVGTEIVWKTLDQISENLDSKRQPITSGFRTSGKIPYYGASGVVDHVEDYIFDGDFLLISEDGANLLARNTPIAFSVSGKIWVNNHAHILKFRTYEERRFIEFYLNKTDLTPYISGAAQPKLNKKNLNSIKFPIPPLKEQQYIVTILDKFDTLVNSISEGLPKEIALRRKQYEYYRERLLSFPKQ